MTIHGAAGLAIVVAALTGSLQPERARASGAADAPGPSIPTGLVAEAPGPSSVVLRWDPAVGGSGAIRYEILRDGRVIGRASGTRGGDEGLQSEVVRCYRVEAVDDAGSRSGPSEERCVATPAMAPPRTLSVDPLSDRSLHVTWSPVSAAAGYEAWRGEALVDRVDGLAVTDVGLAPGTEYCYQVAALDGSSNRSARSARTCARTAAEGSPSAPAGVEATATGPRTVALRWQRAPEANVVYRVYWEGEQAVGMTRVEAFVVPGLRPGQKRCFRVATVDAAGRTSPLSRPACTTTPTGPPNGAR